MSNSSNTPHRVRLAAAGTLLAALLSTPAVGQDMAASATIGGGDWSPSTSNRFDGTWTVSAQYPSNPKTNVVDAKLVIKGERATYEASKADHKFSPCANRVYDATVDQRSGRDDLIRVRIARSAVLAGCSDINWPFKLTEGKLVWKNDSTDREAIRQ